MGWKPIEKNGQKAVIKEFKNVCASAESDWKTYVRNYKKAKELADLFNCEDNHGLSIQYVSIDIQKVSESTTEGTLKINECVVVEDYIEGDYKTFLNNNGWVHPDLHKCYPTIAAFAHWSWVHAYKRKAACF